MSSKQQKECIEAFSEHVGNTVAVIGAAKKVLQLLEFCLLQTEARKKRNAPSSVFETLLEEVKKLPKSQRAEVDEYLWQFVERYCIGVDEDGRKIVIGTQGRMKWLESWGKKNGIDKIENIDEFASQACDSVNTIHIIKCLMRIVDTTNETQKICQNLVQLLAVFIKVVAEKESDENEDIDPKESTATLEYKKQFLVIGKLLDLLFGNIGTSLAKYDVQTTMKEVQAKAREIAQQKKRATASAQPPAKKTRTSEDEENAPTSTENQAPQSAEDEEEKEEKENEEEEEEEEEEEKEDDEEDKEEEEEEEEKEEEEEEDEESDGKEAEESNESS
jgi:hypothetical protein